MANWNWLFNWIDPCDKQNYIKHAIGMMQEWFPMNDIRKEVKALVELEAVPDWNWSNNE